MRRFQRLAASAFCALLLATPGLAAPGTPIDNYAEVRYVGSAGLTTIQSNTVGVVVEPAPSLATLSLLRADPGGAAAVAHPTRCLQAGMPMALPPPQGSNGQPFALGQPLSLGTAAVVHGGEAVFLDLIDADRNRDAAVVESIELILTAASGDQETIVLAETTADSGRFAGYVQTRAAAAARGDCVLQVERDRDLEARYADASNPADTASATALVDPFGVAFDSQTGAAVNGVRVRLVEAASGAPATVYGDDGVSAYPAELVTGQPVTDAGGTVYSFAAGVFRFPLVAAGDYRVVVEPPASHSAPSTVAEAQLQALPGAPYALSPASFGGVLSVAGQVATAVDIPLDPTASALFLDKSTTQGVAAVGDFIPYTVTVRNSSDTATLENVVVTDVLPAGLRYQPDSARLGGGAPIHPEQSADGLTLTFRLPQLDARQSAALHYVAVVANGTAGATVVNRASASADGGLESNVASASVLLREELFRSTALVLGRVYAGACDTTVDQGQSVAGVRVYLEDGRYAVTDDEGKYHFEGLEPGSHVVQLDALTLPPELEPLQCDTRVRSAGNALSQFVDLRGGALGTADFVLAGRAAPTGEALLTLATEQAGDGFTHTATIAARGVPLATAELLAVLPEGLAYVPGSVRKDGEPAAEPEQQSGSLRFVLGEIAADSAPAVTFATSRVGEPVGDLSLQGLLRFTTSLGRSERTAPAVNVVHREESRVERISYSFSPRYNAYSFAPRFGSMQTTVDARDATELDRIASDWRGMRDLTIAVVGHADKTPISTRNRERFPDNYALSAARAQAVADYLSSVLPEARIEIEGRGADEPVDDRETPEALARNRRVEIHVVGVRTLASAEWHVVTPAAETPVVVTTGAFDGAAVELPKLATARPAALAAALEPELDIATLTPQVAILQPSEGFAPPVPTLRVAVSHLPGQEVQLSLNGRPVSALNFDGTESDAEHTVALSRWRGVDLVEGDNHLVATVSEGTGQEIAVLERTVRYGAGGVRAELVREESQLTADGRSQPVIALRIFDASGQPARTGTLGAYSVDPPYRTWWEVETLRDNPLLVVGRREPTFAVEEDGLVRILLEPTAQTGTAVVRLRFNERQEQEIRAWLTPEQRDWILVGLAESTTMHRDLTAALEPTDIEDGYSSDNRLAFFAKGQIKGSTLMTIALDTARDRPLAEERLFGAIEPDRYYTLYGDAVEQRFEAATTRKLYLKIEREQLSALFGDFETGLNITELGRYSRSLTGFKADYGGERFAVNAFAAENRESYGRDEFLGDGTSGPYQLSRGAIVANSDRLRLETRDRIRSEVVVETRVLSRFVDYTLDYFTGTLFFKQPIASRDSSFNPVYVVAEYETLDGAATGTTAGARATTRLAGDKLELGATLVNEGAVTGDTRLAGTDLRFKPTGALELRAEAAQTDSADPLRPGAASAYLAEVERVTERLDLQAYVREQEAGFGVGQQQSSEAGTRKIGVDARTRIGERWTARGEAFRQENLQTGAERELISAEARHETDDTTASIGLRSVADDLPQSGLQRSQLVSLGGSLDVLRDRVTLRALTEQAVSREAESLDFPERTTLGLDYHVTGATTLFAEVEDADGELIDSTMTRLGVRSTPWSGAQISSSMNRELGEYGPRVFANVGLTQSWQLGGAWAMDVGVDRSDTVAGANVERFNANVPLVGGALGEDYTATFVGAQYRDELWTFTTRLERRDSALAERASFIAGFFREPIAGRALSVTARWLDNEAAIGAGRIVDARVSYAYRPGDGRFIVLERLDLTQDERNDSLGRFETTRFVNNVNLHWQLDNRFELGAQIGARYVKSTLDGVQYSGWSSLLGLDVRRDLTRVVDLGLHGTWLDSEAGGTSEHSAGLDVGVSAAKNVWISIGYNFVGFRDEHFDASRYTADGPYVRFRVKVDQDTFKDLDLSRLRPGNR